MKWSLFGFVFVVTVFVDSSFAQGRSCERCVAVEECLMYGDLSRQEQATWLSRESCLPPQQSEDQGISQLFGFAPTAKGDYICCPNSHERPNSRGTGTGGSWRPGNGVTSQRPTSRPQVGQGFGGRQSGRGQIFTSPTRPQTTTFNPYFQGASRTTTVQPDQLDYQDGNEDEDDSYDTVNSRRPNPRRPNFGNNRRSPSQSLLNRRPTTPNPRITLDPGQNPYFLPKTPQNQGSVRGVGETGNSIMGRGECSALTSFPPDINSDCCGRDASDAERILDRQPPSTFQGTGVNGGAPPSSSFPSSFLPSWPSYPLGFSEKATTRVERATQDKNANVTLDTRISGGSATDIGEFPWLVLLKATFDYGSTESAFNCGGSLVSATYVLSAAHCVSEDGARVTDVEVTLAEYDKRTYPLDCVTIGGEGRRCIENVIMHAEDIIPHPQYDETRLQNDISLIRLRGRAPYTEFIRPICLPPIDVDSPDFRNLRLSVSGWGRNGAYNSDVKQATVVNLVPQRDCMRHYPSLTRRHLCAAGYSGEDTCKGDSGGPLMLLYEGKYFVSGIVSGKRADSPCGTSVPSLYTNVYQYTDWIKSIIRNNRRS